MQDHPDLGQDLQDQPATLVLQYRSAKNINSTRRIVLSGLAKHIFLANPPLANDTAFPASVAILRAKRYCIKINSL